MEGKASDWRPGPTVCRCCLSEGCYKDISTEYFWMGKREVYEEMLTETLNISISFSKSGGPNSNSRLICEPCIARLRDATEFKRQVIDCEKTFMHHLDPGSSSSRVTVQTIGDVKVELVKREKDTSDDDFDDRPDFLDVDSDDDLDNQPLTKLASKVPKKEAVDILDLLDNSQITVKRKATLKIKEAPPKKLKKKEVVVKPSASKPAPAKKPTEKKKELKYPTASAAKRNAELIVRHSTVYPFRLPGDCMVCVFCSKRYEEPSNFRKHMDTDHKTFPLLIAFAHCRGEYIKTDCSDIRCRICSEQIESLEELTSHLENKHSKPLDTSAPLGIQPFKPDKLQCTICDLKTFNLRQLSRHTQTHFLRFTCESCGKSCSTSSALQVHIKNSHILRHYCRKCKTQFISLEAKRQHLKESTKCWSHICSLCGDRCVSWVAKQAHMKEAHGVGKEPHTCPECRMVFNDRRTCRKHFRIEHTDNNFVCSFCGMKFMSKKYFEDHRVTHTHERPFPCTVCSKTFPRKKNLSQHMWTHSELKRFECKLCCKKFNQRASWRSHNKVNHPEFTNFEETINDVKYLLSV